MKSDAEKARTLRLKKNLPEGITIGARTDGRKQPFFVRFGPDRKQTFFELESDRNDAAEKMAEQKRTDGAKILDFDPEEWREYLAFKKRVGAPLQEVERVYCQVRDRAATGLSTKAAVQKYQTLRAGEGLAEDSYRHTNTILGRFVEFAGHLPLGAIDADKIRAWLALLKEKRGFQSTTLRHHRKEVNTFFNRACLEKWHSENPCRAVKPPKIAEPEPQFLTLRQAFDFFKANRDQKCIGKIATEAFSGLRCSAAANFKGKKEVDRASNGLVIASLKTTGRRHFVDGFPDNLFLWIDHAAADECWDITARNYDKLKADAFIRAGVKNTGNVFRHSFATHHVAAFRDAARTIVLLCHRNPTMFYNHYKGLGVSQLEALGYFAITPESVLLSFEEFFEKLKSECSDKKKSSA